MADDTATAPQEGGAPQDSSVDTVTTANAAAGPSQQPAGQFEELVAQATAKYAVKDYRSAAELYSRATELQAEVNGEMAPANADLLYAYGRCLYHVAVLNSEVLGSKLAGETKDAPSKKTSSSKAAPLATETAEKKEAESVKTEELVEAVVEEKKQKEAASGEDTAESKPFFVFTGDEGYDESDDEDVDEDGEGAGADDDDDDDFSNAFEVLDLARVLLQKQLEEKKDDKTAARPIEERLADTYDLQAEISLEGEQFANAATDLRSGLTMKTALYPFESSLIAEAHYKLSLALEFAAVTHHKDASGEIDASKPATVDQSMRDEAAQQMEQAIASCRQRIGTEEAKLADAGAGTKGKVTRQGIDEVKEMVVDMEQRLNELKSAPVTVNDPRGTGAPEGAEPLNGILGAILGESTDDQKVRIEEAMKGATDLTGLVKRKRKLDGGAPGPGTETPEKRARTEDAEGS